MRNAWDAGKEFVLNIQNKLKGELALEFSSFGEVWERYD
jgi:hypothetical protein